MIFITLWPLQSWLLPLPSGEDTEIFPSLWFLLLSYPSHMQNVQCQLIKTACVDRVGEAGQTLGVKLPSGWESLSYASYGGCSLHVKPVWVLSSFLLLFVDQKKKQQKKKQLKKPLCLFRYIYFLISFTNNNAKIQRQKPSHEKNTSGTVQTEAYFILNIAHIYSQLGFFWSDSTVKIENTQFEEQGLNQ